MQNNLKVFVYDYETSYDNKISNYIVNLDEFILTFLYEIYTNILVKVIKCEVFGISLYYLFGTREVLALKLNNQNII